MIHGQRGQIPEHPVIAAMERWGELSGCCRRYRDRRACHHPPRLTPDCLAAQVCLPPAGMGQKAFERLRKMGNDRK